MTIQQLIDEQMKEFDFSFYPDLVEMHINYRDSRKNVTVATIDDFKSFILSYTRKLIEALGEELVGESEKPLFSERYKCKSSEEKALRKRGRNELRDIQRLKLKEILSSISK